MAERESNRIFWVIGAIALLSVSGLITTIAISLSHDVSDGYIPLDEREPAGDPEAQHALDAGAPNAAEPTEPTEAVEASPSYDEAAIARVLADGGTARELMPLDPTPRRIAPTTPDRALSRAHFWQGMLDTQVGQLQSRLTAARDAGNEGLASRLERQIARLEAQRAPLESRIGELETDVEQTEATADPSDPRATDELDLAAPQ